MSNVIATDLYQTITENRLNKQLLNDDEYRQLLTAHFKELPEKEINFFVNSKRFNLFQSLMGEKLGTEVKSLLNVACGPFAFENYVEKSNLLDIDAFDIDNNICGLFRDLRAMDKFEHVHFRTSSAEDYSTSKKYDLVLINDLFYHKGVDFFGLFDGLANPVSPQGYIYFDLLDVRAGRIWSALGKDSRFVRYDLDEIKAKVQQSGFDVLSITPSLGIGGSMDFAVRKFLLTTLNIANNYIFVAKRK